MILRCVFVISFLFVTACRKESNSEPNPPKQKPTSLIEFEVDESLWVRRANSILRHGLSLNPDSPAYNTSLSPRERALSLMEDGGFADTIVDFSSYWMGQRPDFLREQEYKEEYVNGNRIRRPLGVWFKEDVVGHAASINGARAVFEGKSYFDNFFAENGPSYYREVLEPYFYDYGSSSSSTQQAASHEGRAEIRKKILGFVKGVAASVRPLAAVEMKAEFCKAFDEANGRVGFSIGVAVSTSFNFFDYSSFERLEDWCDDNFEIYTDRDLLKLLARVIPEFEADIRYLAEVERVTQLAPPRSVAEVENLYQAIDKNTLKTASVPQWNTGLFFKLQNSSTNRNRKRASWVLKRFFCDDLTPVNVEIPQTHSMDAHGSDPACYSCHFKLDPMSGYFRELGSFGTSFAEFPNIFFDDGVEQERSTFELPWKSRVGSGREWDIGYIRSVNDESKNTYGGNLGDLMTLLRTAPEVKECFVRRVFEYALGEEQAFDPGWIREVSGRFEEMSKSNPSLAFKGVFADVVSGNTYRVRDRNSAMCYDVPQGVDPATRAPCRIATLLDRHCVSCHSKASPLGGLDLSSWVNRSDGLSGFVHKTSSDEPSTKESVQTIIDRLTSSDDNMRMPYKKDMPDEERNELVAWAQKYLKSISQ